MRLALLKKGVSTKWILAFFTFMLLFRWGDACAQGLEKALNADFYPEQGCPVQLTAVRSVLEVDPFGAPTASKIYLTYTNNAQKPIAAVKFRCRYSDNEGKDRGTFHAPDVATVSPGGSRSHKWKREGGLNPSISGFQIRVLQVKYADGSGWESQKMQELTGQGVPNLQEDQAQETPNQQTPVWQSQPQQTPVWQSQPQQAPSWQNQPSPFQQEPPPTSPQSSQSSPPSQPQGQAPFDKTKELDW